MYSTRISEKNIVFAGIFALILFSGCDSNLLDTVPEDRLSTETYWETEQDARLAVNDLYNDLPGQYTLVWDSMSDIAIPNNAFWLEKEFQQGINDALNPVGTNHWNGSYGGIRAVNEFLANVDRVETDDQELIDRFKAEARTIRAFEYIRLVMVFGDVPLTTEPLSIEESKTIERTGTEQIWDFIETELTESVADLPETYPQEEEGRITKGAALALKSRAMLYAGRYQQARDAAQSVMDMGIYGLYSSYENLFSYAAENNQEVILDRQYVRDLRQNDIFEMFGLSAMGRSPAPDVPAYPVPTIDIVNAYEMSNGMAIDEPGSGYDPTNPYEDRDPRLGYSIFVLGDELPNGNTYDPRPGGLNDISRGQATTNTGFDVKKYVNFEDLPNPANSGINVVLMRYAEVLLNYAEAKIELNEIDQSVYDAINEIRQRPDVNMPPINNTGQSQSEMRQIVRHERMVELAFEGQRFFDIRRWRIAENVMQGPILGASFVQDIFADRSGWSIHDVDSEAGGFPSGNVLDGDTGTFWHTEFGPAPPHPHHIAINMGETQNIHGIKLTGRLDDFDRGNPMEILIEVSSNGTNWGNGVNFTLDNVDVNTVHFSSPQQAQYFRITIISSYQNTDFTHLSEIDVSVDQNEETVVFPDYDRNFDAPKHYLWAIPQKELELNPNLTQNPGY